MTAKSQRRKKIIIDFQIFAPCRLGGKRKNNAFVTAS
jgi:hypothetical protein